jgi:hypothetical protein
MRFTASAVALGLGALAATPCLALTIQAAPPTPDVAQHLRPSTNPLAPPVLPGPDNLKNSFVASGRPQLGQGFYSAPSAGTTTSSFGSLHVTTTVSPGYGSPWTDTTSPRDTGNPWSLTAPRR